MGYAEPAGATDPDAVPGRMTSPQALARFRGPCAARGAACWPCSPAARPASGAVDVNNGGEFRFVAGTPAGEVIPEASGPRAPEFSGRLLGGGDVRLSPAARAGRRPELLGLLVRALPGGDAGVQRGRRATSPTTACSSSASTSRRPSEQFATAFVDRFGIAFPSLYDPRGEVALAFRDYPANAIPSTIVLDPQGRVAAVYTGAVARTTCARCSTGCGGGERPVGETFRGLVTDGPLLVAAAVAALVGLISFASPCVLPLVPGYLSYVAGLVGTGVGRPPTAPAGGGATATAVRTEVAPRAAGWCSAPCCSCSGSPPSSSPSPRRSAGWAGCCSSTPTSSTGCSAWSRSCVGLGFLGWLPLLQRTKRLTARPAAGLAGAPLLGVVFGLGWTPCLGPTLAAVYSLAFTEATAARGAVLGLAYCLGLGVPFVLVALGARWAVGATAFLRRHARTVTRVGGAVLVLVGLLLLTGAWTELMGWLRSWLAATGFGEWQSL